MLVSESILHQNDSIIVHDAQRMGYMLILNLASFTNADVKICHHTFAGYLNKQHLITLDYPITLEFHVHFSFHIVMTLLSTFLTQSSNIAHMYLYAL